MKLKLLQLSSDGGGSVGLEVSSESSFARSWNSLNNGELKLRVSVYSSGRSSDIITLSNNRSFDNLDGLMRSLMFTTHFHKELRYGSIQADVSEFFVHIVDSSSRLISKNDTIGLNSPLASFEDLANTDNFTLSSLELVESSSLEPELGLSNNWRGSKDSDGNEW